MKHKIAISVTLVPSLLVLLAGCGGSASGNSATSKLEPTDVRPALQMLPYHLTLRQIQGPKGNTASFRGRAHGPYHTTLEFSIGIGNQPQPISVTGAGTAHVVYNEELGFVFNDDGEVARKFKTPGQWREVSRMATKVEQSLCRAANGQPCPI
jgi:hypothetical protein